MAANPLSNFAIYITLFHLFYNRAYFGVVTDDVPGAVITFLNAAAPHLCAPVKNMAIGYLGARMSAQLTETPHKAFVRVARTVIWWLLIHNNMVHTTTFWYTLMGLFLANALEPLTRCARGSEKMVFILRWVAVWASTIPWPLKIVQGLLETADDTSYGFNIGVVNK